jgi:formate hydrogenlyase transcriptional activator
MLRDLRHPTTKVEIESRTDEIRRLKACINDLVSVLTLPAIWSGHEEPSHIGNTLLDVLLGLLRLDFAYLRLGDSFGGGVPMEMIHVGQRRNLTAQPEEVGRALNNWLTEDPSTSPFLVPNPVGKGKTSIALRHLGLQDQIGVLVAGSARADFPTRTERVILDVAVNQAAVGLHEAWRLIEQRQIADELDRRVAQRTRELVEREARIRRLVDANIIGVLISNLDGQITESNDAFLKMVGYSREDLVSGQIRWTDLTPTEWQAVSEQAVAKIKATGACEVFEKEYCRKDGSRVPVLMGAAALEGTPAQTVAFVLDLTERKRAEEELRASEQKYRHLVDTTPAFVHTALPNGDVDFYNRGWLEYVGIPLTDLLGWGWSCMIHPEDLETIVPKWRAALEAGEPFVGESRVRRADGEYRWFLHREEPLRNEAGEIVKWYGSSIEIEERKIAEEKIREQEIELRQILDLTPQHIGVLAPDGSRLYANHTQLEYFGVTLEQWRDLNAQMELAHPEDQERFIAEHRQRFLEGKPYEFEGRLRRHDGEFRCFLFRLTPLKDEGGQITRWYATATDIEDRKRAEEEIRKENIALREEIIKTSMFEEIVGNSPALQQVLVRVAKVAPTDSTVLITGETGTGKELIARAIHKASKRADRAFVSVNCAAIPPSLIPSELFGHEKGAFTGAIGRRLGRFELAEGGTIFLDEIGELPPETQVALLRVLQEREFERVGGNRSIKTNVRVIVATNRDLPAAIAAGTFREDLFYRLNVFPIEIPPLRQRKEDIPLLVEYFIDRYAREAGKNIRTVSKETLDLFQSYPWPGNIRELRNVIERSVIVCETESFSVDESWLSRQPLRTSPTIQHELRQKVAAEEKQAIEAALTESGGRVFGPSGAAARLGIARSTLESKIKTLKIDKNRFKVSNPS